MDARDDPVRAAPGALLLPAGLALLAGLYAGLARIGWGVPALPVAPPADHGPLMVGGFLGTLITLERAVALGHGPDRAGGTATDAQSGRRRSGAAALGRRGGFAFPALAGLGALALLAGGAWAAAGPVLITAASGGLVGLSLAITRRQPALHHVALSLGAASWLAGNLAWLAGWPVFRLVPWWIAFLVLTIAGERLELSRVLRPGPASRAAFAVAMAALLAGPALAGAAPAAGDRVLGVALLATAAWLFRYDVTRRTIRQRGLTRYIAVAMLSGYAWLAAAGVLFGVEAGRLVGGPPYDAALHAVFVGFVFSMIFGHAPIILPAVTGLAMAYRRSFYAHLALLHASLVLRVAGDLGGWWAVRRWGGLLNAAAILLFVAATATSVRRRAGRSAAIARPRAAVPGIPARAPSAAPAPRA